MPTDGSASDDPDLEDGEIESEDEARAEANEPKRASPLPPKGSPQKGDPSRDWVPDSPQIQANSPQLRGGRGGSPQVRGERRGDSPQIRGGKRGDSPQVQRRNSPLARGRQDDRRGRRPRPQNENDEPEKKKRKGDDEAGASVGGDDEENEDEMLGLCMRGGSPSGEAPLWKPKMSGHGDTGWGDETVGGEERKSKRNNFRMQRDERDRNRVQMKRRMKPGRQKGVADQDVCLAYLKGSCMKGAECNYSHNVAQPRKMELCKFFLKDCCVKREKCLYLHEEFPCKFFHTGQKCYQGIKCKFSHDPLTPFSREILLKHVETAPKDILGDFPRLSRVNAEAALDRNTDERSRHRRNDEEGTRPKEERRRRDDDDRPREDSESRQDERRIRDDDRRREDQPRRDQEGDQRKDGADLESNRRNFDHDRPGRPFDDTNRNFEEGNRRNFDDKRNFDDSRRRDFDERRRDDQRSGDGDINRMGDRFDDNRDRLGDRDHRTAERLNDQDRMEDRMADREPRDRMDVDVDHRASDRDRRMDEPDHRMGDRGDDRDHRAGRMNDREPRIDDEKDADADRRGDRFDDDRQRNRSPRPNRRDDEDRRRPNRTGDSPRKRGDRTRWSRPDDNFNNQNFNNFGPNNQNFGPNGPNGPNNNFRPNGPNFGPNQNNFGPNGPNFPFNFPFGPNGPNGPNFPNNFNFGPNGPNNNFGPNGPSGPSGPNNFGPFNQGNFPFGPNGNFGNNGPNRRPNDGPRDEFSPVRERRFDEDEKPTRRSKEEGDRRGNNHDRPNRRNRRNSGGENKDVKPKAQLLRNQPAEEGSTSGTESPYDFAKELAEYKNKKIEMELEKLKVETDIVSATIEKPPVMFNQAPTDQFGPMFGDPSNPVANYPHSQFPHSFSQDGASHGPAGPTPDQVAMMLGHTIKTETKTEMDDGGAVPFTQFYPPFPSEEEKNKENKDKEKKGGSSKKHHHKKRRRHSKTQDETAPPDKQPHDETEHKGHKKQRLSKVKRARRKEARAEKRQPVIVTEDGSFGGIKFKIKLNNTVNEEKREVSKPHRLGEFMSSDDEVPLNRLQRRSSGCGGDGDETDTESNLVIATYDEPEEKTSPHSESANDQGSSSGYPAHLPRRQQELFLRIQSQQHNDSLTIDETSHRSGSPGDKTPPFEPTDQDQDQNWYSSDDEEPKGTTPPSSTTTTESKPTPELRPASIPMPETVKANFYMSAAEKEPVPERSTTPPGPPPAAAPPKIELAALKDLSKINITELLSSIRQITSSQQADDKSQEEKKDPRVRDPRLGTPGGASPQTSGGGDPKNRRPSGEERPPYAKSIYSYTPASTPVASNKDSDMRLSLQDVDERVIGDIDQRLGDVTPTMKLGLPFKPVPMHTAATEIDASLASHPFIEYKIEPIDIPTADYTTIKISRTDPMAKKDPRLRRLFRLSSVEEPKPDGAIEAKKPTVPTDPRRKAQPSDTPKSPDTPFSPPQEQQGTRPPQPANLIAPHLLAIMQLGLSAATGGAAFDPRLRGMVPKELEALATIMNNLRPEDMETLRANLEPAAPPIAEPPRLPGQGLLPTPGMGLLGTAPPNFMMNQMMGMDGMMAGPMGPLGPGPMGPGPMGPGPMGPMGGMGGPPMGGPPVMGGPFGFPGENSDSELRMFRGGGFNNKNERRGNRNNWRGRDRNWPRGNRDRDRNRDKEDRREKRSFSPD